MKVSVLIPYYTGRRTQLERTLGLLRHQTYKNYDVWIIDDGSRDDIKGLCGGRVIYEKIRPADSAPRSANMAWNHAYGKCDGEFIILTHPEYMPPLYAIARMVEKYEGYRLGPIAYALSRQMMLRIDELPWEDDLDILQTLPGFMEFENPWGWRNHRAPEWCHHFAFTGQPRSDWDRTNFIPVTEERGFDDSWIIVPEADMGRPSQQVGFAVYHQDHLRWEEWVGLCESQTLQLNAAGEVVPIVPMSSARLRRIEASRNNI